MSGSWAREWLWIQNWPWSIIHRFIINIESDNEWLDLSQQIYSVTISKKQMEADFLVEIQGYKRNSLLGKGEEVPWMLKKSLVWNQK